MHLEICIFITGDEVINKELKKDLIPNDPVAGGSGIGKALVTKAPVEEKIPTAKTKFMRSK